MADVTVDIAISLVSYKAWLTSSYIASAMIGDGGTPLVVNNELGPDQEDAFTDFLNEAAREVSKLFVSRQGNVTGTPFEKTSTNVKYRFNEETPVLPQASAIKDTLTEQVKNALFSWVTFLWLTMKKNNELAAFILSRYQQLSNDIEVSLYKLHD